MIIKILTFLLLAHLSYSDDMPSYLKKSCFKGMVVSSEQLKNSDLYMNQIIQYGRNEMHSVLTSEKLDEKQEKYYQITKSDQPFFGKSIPDVVKVYNKIIDCNFRALPMDLKLLNAIKFNCLHAPNKCLEWFGFYRVQFDPNSQIFKNEYENYLRVEHRKKNIKIPNDDHHSIESISVIDNQKPIDYRPNLDKCYYLNVPSYTKSFSDWIYVLTKCDF